MSIVEKRVGKDGTLWGWDDRQGDWVELDAAAEQGSTLGNLGRAAARGFGTIGQGLQELTPLDDNPIHPELLTAEQQQRANAGQLLEAQSQAASRAAPIAEAIGGAAPEIAAGVGAGIMTGGLGLVPALAGQAAAGAFTGFLRPGDTTERAASAALGAAFGLFGEAVPAGAQALKGTMLGLKMGEAITGRASARVANELDVGLSRVEAATAGSGGEAGSVGAARTPQGELGEQALRESQALDIDEAAGANTSNKYDIHQRARLEAEGYKSPLGAQTRLGSAARAAEAVDEFTLEGSINKSYRANNQKMAVQYASRALGDPDWAARETIELSDLADTRVRLESKYDQLESMAPTIDGKAIAREIKKVISPGGVFEDTRVEAWLKKTLEKAEKIEVEDGPTMMANLRRIRDMATDASKNGDQHGADALLKLHQQLSDVMGRAAERQGNDAFVEEWKRANSQYRVMKMLEASGSVSGTRDINPKSLLGKMKQNPVSGGFGSAGPDRATPEGKLWDLVSLMDKDQTHVPATGVRQLLVRKGARAAATVGGGAAGVYGLGQLFGN